MLLKPGALQLVPWPATVDADDTHSVELDANAAVPGASTNAAVSNDAPTPANKPFRMFKAPSYRVRTLSPQAARAAMLYRARECKMTGGEPGFNDRGANLF